MGVEKTLHYFFFKEPFIIFERKYLFYFCDHRKYVRFCQVLKKRHVIFKKTCFFDRDFRKVCFDKGLKTTNFF